MKNFDLIWLKNAVILNLLKNAVIFNLKNTVILKLPVAQLFAKSHCGKLRGVWGFWGQY